MLVTLDTVMIILGKVEKMGSSLQGKFFAFGGKFGGLERTYDF